MQSLRSKSNHIKFIMLPLVITLLVTLDISESINELLGITLETKGEFEDVVVILTSRRTCSSASC